MYGYIIHLQFHHKVFSIVKLVYTKYLIFMHTKSNRFNICPNRPAKKVSSSIGFLTKNLQTKSFLLMRPIFTFAVENPRMIHEKPTYPNRVTV